MNHGSMAMIWKQWPSCHNGSLLVLHTWKGAAKLQEDQDHVSCVFWLGRCCPSQVCPSKTNKEYYLNVLHWLRDAIVFGIPRSASSSHTVSCQPLLIAAHSHLTFPGSLLVAGLPEHGSLSTDSQPSLKHLCQTFIVLHSLKAFKSSLRAFWTIQILSTKECSSLT